MPGFGYSLFAGYRIFTEESNMKRFIALALVCAMAVTAAASCAEKVDEPEESADITVAEETVEETEPDPLEGLNYEDASFRVLTSTNDPGGVGNSNYLVEGPEEENGDIVEDTVYARNRAVEELLGVKLVFTQVNLSYTEVGSYISKFVATAADEYEVIIQDLFPCAELVIEGMFTNVKDGEHFDFTKNYWNAGAMDDISLSSDAYQLMVGDFFIDVLRGSHALFFNKNLMTDLGMDPSDLYNTVTVKEWTYDRFIEMISTAYSDLNGNGKTDKEDRFGFVAMQKWGPSIPWIVSAGLDFVNKTEDGIELANNNERSVTFLDKLIEIFWNDAAYTNADSNDEPMFTNGQALFLGYQRLGSLEKFRDMDFDVSLVPYPMLDEMSGNYTTSIHDTTEVGVIPVTSNNLEMSSAVLEALCRETNRSVIPAYYETALKVKYTRDDEAAQMIDIIHDNVGNMFVLAYDNYINQIFMKNVFYFGNLETGTNKFASSYARSEKSANRTLTKMIEKYEKNNVG